MFAGSRCEYQKADYVIAGVPFDLTSSFRAGTAEAPGEIRRMSYCFEPFMMEYGVSLSDLNIHDIGNIENCDTSKGMGEELYNTVEKVARDGKFPIIIGGEHSISPHVVSALQDVLEDVSVLVLDAHLDYRNSYEGMEYSHATASRRIRELGCRGMKICGVRSLSGEEWLTTEKPHYLTASDIMESGDHVKLIMDGMEDKVYLSVDMDVFDPSHAPGVGNPEPYGLAPMHYKRLISALGPHLVGFDIVEVCPRYDHGGITSNLAARMIYDLLGARFSR